jgi:hypothetical protein
MLRLTGAHRRIGQRIDGAEIGGQKYVERPAAAAALRMQKIHQKLINVRPLFPINLDADIMTVKIVGCIAVRESLGSHDVTPMTGCVAYGNKKRFSLGNCAGNYFRAPFLPPYGIGNMLEKIRG